MGPRTKLQNLQIAKRFNVNPQTYCIWNEKDNKLYHTIHKLAQDIYDNCEENVNVFERTGSSRLSIMFAKESSNSFLKERVQLLSSSPCIVRAKTKHNIFNKEKLEEFVKNMGIKGMSIAELCAEYGDAYKDISNLIEEKIFWSVDNFVWHTQNVVSKGSAQFDT